MTLKSGLEGSGARVLVSDDLELAAQLGLGVHLSEDGPKIERARAALGGQLVGASRHDAAGLFAAQSADYATLSPVLASPGKGPPMGWTSFASALPPGLAVLALGGIEPSDAAAAAHAGAAGVAAIRSAWTAPAKAWAQALSAWTR